MYVRADPPPDKGPDILELIKAVNGTWTRTLSVPAHSGGRGVLPGKHLRTKSMI